MEIIGFLFVVLLAAALLCYGCILFSAQAMLGSSNKGDTVAVIFVLGLACCLFYWTYHNSPFTVGLK